MSRNSYKVLEKEKMNSAGSSDVDRCEVISILNEAFEIETSETALGSINPLSLTGPELLSVLPSAIVCALKMSASERPEKFLHDFFGQFTQKVYKKT